MKILIVDDNSDNLILERGMLESHGFEVEEARDGLEGLNIAQKNAPDLIISDIMMPQMDGFTFCRVIKGIDRLKEIPFVFYTATYLEKEDEKLGLALGAARYIHKPTEPMDFLRQIDTIIEEYQKETLSSQSTSSLENNINLDRFYQERISQKLNKKVRDVARLKLEEELILSTTSDGILALDTEGKHTIVNQAAAHLLGYEVDEMLGKQSHPMWHHSYEDGTPFPEKECPIYATMEHGQVIVQSESLFWRKDGSNFPVEYSSSPFIENGNIKGVVVIFRDITQRKSHEYKLHQYATVFKTLGEGVFITDANANIISVNPAFTTITGYTSEEMIGKTPKVLSSGRQDKEFYVQMWDTLHKEGEWQGEMWNRKKNGQFFPEWLTITTNLDEKGKLLNYIGVFSDISTIKKTEDDLRFLAHHDPLTGLPNRILLQEHLEHALEHAHKTNGKIALLFLDLDRFKEVNDSLGHPLGDLLLQKVANQLLQTVHDEDMVARPSGDEFVILLENVKSSNKVALVAQKILTALNHPEKVEEHDITMTASIGIAISPTDGADTIALFKNADTALYRAKDKGRNSFEFYSEDMGVSSLETLYLNTALNTALQKEQFTLYYQPQIDAQTGNAIGAEALVRWNSPDMGLVSPLRFIPLVEDTGLIVPLGEWILHKACTQMKQWIDKGIALDHVAVNISGRQLSHNYIVDTIKNILRETRLDPKYLELEITESVIMKDEHYVAMLNELKSLGLRISIDDFGTGYSSLSRLKNLPIDKLKIDKSFIDGIPGDEDDNKIVQVIIGLANGLNLNLIAEGVETSQQKDFLLKQGCKHIQGYLYSKPLPPKEFEEWIALHSKTLKN